MIKKIFMILFSLSILLGLFACDNDETYMYTINDIYESIEIGYAEDNQSNYVTQSITLPTTSTLDERAVISWFSLYQNIVSNEGIVIRGDNDQVVVLTYTIEYAGMTVYGNESVTVIGLNDTHVYIITFDSVGGSDIESVIANEGDAIVAPETPINEGYQFAGWFTTENYTRVFTFSTMPSGNLTLYAKWNYIDENVYVITFDSNGGSAVEVISNNGGVSINEPNEPTKDGYVFAGWYSDQEFTLNFTFNYMPYESVILYAKWVDEASYTGYYDGAAGLYGDQLESFLYEIIHDGFHGV
ncbi:MAG: InlB B-repeat-containing protein, partial [Acholeplasmataceae bacterium]